MQTFEQIQYQVIEWSIENFGMYETPYLAIMKRGGVEAYQPRKATDKADTSYVSHGVQVAGLNSLIPLMQIAEKVGDLVGAEVIATERLVGDIGILLCDYCCRENITFPVHVNICKTDDEVSSFCGVVRNIGRIIGAHSRFHQRIHGFHIIETFIEERDVALRNFIWYIEKYAKGITNYGLLTLLNQAWNSILKSNKR